MRFPVYIALLFAASIAISPVYGAKKSLPDTLPVPGKVLDHEGISLNPTPVAVSHPYSGILNLSAGISTSEIPAEMRGALSGIKQSACGIPVKISIDKNSLAKSKPGAYRLEIGPDHISIAGYDDDGIYYGLQTLHNIIEEIEKSGKDDLPMMVVDDYPEFKYRGVVEGFYGRPWSHETRLSLIDFMGRNKMNSYVYGPKDDPYHRTPDWRKPYPAEEGKKIMELAERCRKNRMNFVWAIHPGGDIRWGKADYDSLLNKFESMYDLGVRQFAVFFDDIKGEGTDSKRQAALLNSLVRDFVRKKGDVGNLIVCPTDYNQGWANPSEKGQLAVYGTELDPEVEVFWTGKVVCGDIENESLEFVDSRINRPALVWWNFPVTDYCRHNLLLGPVYGLETTLDSSKMAGIESNPMENGEASKGAIYGVADYAWNPSAYNPLDNWNRSFHVLMPGASEEYATFAIHSADPPKNYRRNESWNVKTFSYNNYTPEMFEALRKEFQAISEAPGKMFDKGENIPLLVEIAPWLVEFENLGKRGLMALDLIKTYESGNKEKFQKDYRKLKLINDIQRPGYLDHRSGTLKLQPFIDNVLKELKEKI